MLELKDDILTIHAKQCPTRKQNLSLCYYRLSGFIQEAIDLKPIYGKGFSKIHLSSINTCEINNEPVISSSQLNVNCKNRFHLLYFYLPLFTEQLKLDKLVTDFVFDQDNAKKLRFQEKNFVELNEAGDFENRILTILGSPILI